MYQCWNINKTVMKHTCLCNTHYSILQTKPIYVKLFKVDVNRICYIMCSVHNIDHNRIFSAHFVPGNHPRTQLMVDVLNYFQCRVQTLRIWMMRWSVDGITVPNLAQFMPPCTVYKVYSRCNEIGRVVPIALTTARLQERSVRQQCTYVCSWAENARSS